MTAKRPGDVRSPNDQDSIDRAVADAELRKDVGYIRSEVDKLNVALTKNYLTRQEGEILKARLKLLERVVYTAVGVILIAVISAGLNRILT